jgi:hypothetical protein
MAGGGLRGCRYSFAKFTTPELREADFLAAPMVLLLGQYSTGKTSMIEYLIDSSIPGRHIGPEPTTDKFVAVMHGEGESADTIVPGHAAVSQSDLAFKSLETYGSSFLPKFEVARVDSEILRQLTIGDAALCRARRPHHPALRLLQAGYLGRGVPLAQPPWVWRCGDISHASH